MLRFTKGKKISGQFSHLEFQPSVMMSGVKLQRGSGSGNSAVNTVEDLKLAPYTPQCLLNLEFNVLATAIIVPF